MPDKAKLGELVVDRRVWVRERLSLDQVRCLVNDLVNGAEFPPLLVDRETKVIVSGNHRYAAYKQYFGEGWEEREVEVEWVDLPSFEEDPAAWYRLAVEENRHLGERMRYADRNRAASLFLRVLEDPNGEEALEIARLLRFTPDTWRQFQEVYFKHLAEREKRGQPQLAARKDERVQGRPRRVGYAKTTTDDITPADAKFTSFNAQVQSRAAVLLSLLEEGNPDYLSERSRELLRRLADVIAWVLRATA